MTRVAIIGAGNNAEGHARSFVQIEGVEVVGVADAALERAEALAATAGGRAFADHRQLLDDCQPEAVWICTPCWLHAEQSVDCARAGAHVMCEKPMALNLADCDRMIAAAKENGVKLMVGQTTRYMPALVELKRRFERGDFGRLVNAWSTRQSYFAGGADSWRFDGEKSGGIVMEWEIHEIDFVRSIGGAVSRVYARTDFSRPEHPSFLDHFSALLSFGGGGYGNLEASQSCLIGQGGRGLVGTEGAAEALGAQRYRLRTAGGDTVEEVELDAGQGMRLVPNRQFVEAIRADAPSPVSGEDARHNIEIGLAIVRSGETGQVVDLPLE